VTRDSILDILARAFAIAALGLFLGLVCRGALAYACGVFSEAQVEAKLPEASRAELERFREEQASRIRLLAQLEEQLGSTPSPEMLRASQELRDRLKSATPPVRIIAFLFSDTMLLWPLLYTTLGWLVFLLAPSSHLPWYRLGSRALPWALVIYAAYRWPTVLRASFPQATNRRIFAAANWDISPPYFIGQEATVFLFLLLVAAVWVQWSNHTLEVRWRLAQAPRDPLRYVTSDELVGELAEEYSRWRIASVALAAGFLGYTGYFWGVLVTASDQRYLASAVIIHAIWATTWGILSQPLVVRWREWSRRRTKVILSLVESSLSTRAGKKSHEKMPLEEGKVAADLLREVVPISQSSVILTAITAAVSFFAPLLGLLR